jgi:hypothetical protein
MISVVRSSLYLSDNEVNYLKENFYLEHLKKSEEGAFLNFLHPNDQIMV